jgi:sugar/nucleoside kinase (ribokinase family)
MPGNCVVIGDLMMDVTARIESDIAYGSDTPALVSLQPGGSAANTAAWMAATDATVTLIGCVGDDAFGHALRANLVGLGVDARLDVVAGHGTGTCVILVDHRRERTMFPDPGANSALDADRVVAALDAAHGEGRLDHLHLSGYALLNPGSRAAGLAALEHARTLGATVSLDPASAVPLAANLALVRGLLPDLDVLVANEAEAEVLSGGVGTQALTSLAREVPLVVVKRGALGVSAVSDGSPVERPALAVDVVDTTGAGDAFAAGFLPAWLSGATLVEAVDAGQELAALAVGRVGASPMVA